MKNPLKVTIDLETRSAVNLKIAGAWRYSEDPTTTIICCAFKINSDPAFIWFNPSILPGYDKIRGYTFGEILNHLLSKNAIFEAHNAEFERAMFKNVGCKEFGWSSIPLKQWRCSAAKAAYYNLPRALNEVCKVLDLPVQKDMEGHQLMLRLSRPISYENENPVWDNDSEKILRLGEYCKRDVDSEFGFSESMNDISAFEQEVWFVDQMINERGIKVDLESIKAIIYMIDQEKRVLLNEFKALIDNQASIKNPLVSPTQTQKLLSWLQTKGLNLKNVQKETIEKALKIKTLSATVRRVLELRLQLSRSSIAKYDRILEMVCNDGRVRGLFMYNGAGPGRWAGKAIQLQNLTRGTYKDSELCLSFIKARRYDVLNDFYDPLLIAAKKLMRAVFIADDGNELIDADFSSIEGRGLAWLANEAYVIDNYHQGKDAYIVFATKIYPDYSYEEIREGYKNKNPEFELMRYEGKTGELACGYRGGEKAVKRFAPDIPKKRRRQIVNIWRLSRPETVNFWNNLQGAAIETIKTGQRTKVGKIAFGLNNNFLQMRLPSGRVIYYYRPSLIQTIIYAYKYTEQERTKTGELINVEHLEYSQNENEDQINKELTRFPEKDFLTWNIQYYGMDEQQNWTKQTTHGGKLAENATQGMARDFFAEGLVRLERNGFPIVLHAHDEGVAEVKIGTKTLDEFIEILSILPQWAKDCPITANGWVGKRYRK